MSLGRCGPREQRLWIGADELPRSPGHPFYAQLSRLLSECDFDRYVEGLCEPFCADRTGRPSIPPGVYFRMLFVGYFEGIDSQRGIAWRCSDSLSIREFLGLGTTDRAPNHSSLTVIRKRLSLEVHLEVFRFVVDMAAKKKLLKGKSIAVDATLLEANAAMKSIVRRDTGENWMEYVRRLAEAEGIKEPNDDDLRRFDRRRKEKKVGNDDGESKSDPDSRIMKMKDGRTHFSYKAEHAIDLDSEMIVAATIFHGDVSDPNSLMETLSEAEATLSTTNGATIEELVADKGYHEGPTLAACEGQGIRTYVPECQGSPKQVHPQFGQAGPPSTAFPMALLVRSRTGRFDVIGKRGAAAPAGLPSSRGGAAAPPRPLHRSAALRNRHRVPSAPSSRAGSGRSSPP